MKLHPLPSHVRDVVSPESFTYPFCYEPHPLCMAAAEDLKSYIAAQPQWQEELQTGKMLGVLVVQSGKTRGYLAAFSGTLGGQTLQDYFVPPVFDLMSSDNFFQTEQADISRINVRVMELQQQIHPSSLRQDMEVELAAFRQMMRREKTLRHETRARLSPDELSVVEPELIRQSQFQKAEYKRLQQYWCERMEQSEAHLLPLRQELERLQSERRERSISLQHWLFKQFSFLNANGQKKNLLQLFDSFAPPSGAGDCCAPKLLQAAYQHHYHPLCMAEFWMGASPKDEIRLEGRYYPACQSKCYPILSHMLQGLSVDPNPLLSGYLPLLEHFRILFHDALIAVVYKPAGMLSVPGKEHLPSVQDLVRNHFPHAQGPLVVHRLDMDTSGLMVVALTHDSYRYLQRQFLHREVHKTYIALLERPMLVGEEGDIRLPLAADYVHRPRQLVDNIRGKSSHTHYRVLENQQGSARVALFPHTGRTHQLRVHCAHPDGLNNPIVGDRLYGTPAQRLMLHAGRLAFRHPSTGEEMVFDVEEI